jgi:hypothetical protein
VIADTAGEPMRAAACNPTLPYALQIDGKANSAAAVSRIAVAAQASVAQPLLLTLLGFKAAAAA